MDQNNFCIIMAGGVGARFWPMSRQHHPKQFIDILGTGETLIQSTFRRFKKVCPPENIYIVTNEIYKALVLEQLPVTEEQVLCEPSRRNTAPCIAYANYRILERNPEANIVVAPSDHIILKEDNFTEVITAALNATAENDWLLTLGIRPSRPDTGYGYIQYDDNLGYDKDARVKKVKTFTEKPQLDMAKQFIASGDFLWNSGIFIWKLKTILDAFDKYLPDVDQLFKAGIGRYATENEDDFIRQTYTMCKSISIDYGVMEKANNVYVLASDFGWSDLGTWGSLYETRTKDKNENAVVGQQVMLYDSSNCIVNMPKDKLVVLHGLDGYIVVEDNGILLVCRKGDEQQIRQFVNDVMIEKGDKYI
ncbi:MAG: mannose-1-phosphate guanylyltransferase [Lentimicrobium sp.]|jgi:mannose-1-phosphate guanylyltransferase|nr:mannose-1-phosphate guanylyltransferase [Lentimicrobium sp.]